MNDHAGTAKFNYINSKIKVVPQFEVLQSSFWKEFYYVNQSGFTSNKIVVYLIRFFHY
jgi:hypothetical protein